MKITMYELLGMIKDGKAPKYIKHCGAVYSSLYFENTNSIDYEDVKSGDLLFADRIIINERLNDEVEILEEEKKIPENNFNYIYSCEDEHIMTNFENIQTTLKDIIDYLKSKGE